MIRMITNILYKRRKTVVVRMLHQTIFKRSMFGRGRGHDFLKKVMTQISDTFQNSLQNTKTLANQANSTKQTLPMSTIPKIGTSSNSVGSSPEKSPTSLSKVTKPLELTFTSSSVNTSYLPKQETFSTSGSASLSDYERLKIENNSEYNALFKETCLVYATKIIYHLFKEPLSKEQIFDKIPLLYANVLTIANKNKELYGLLQKKGPSFVQHFVTLIMEDRRFALEILKTRYPNINLDYHDKKVSFALGLELFIFSKSFYKTIEKKGYSIIIIDHQSPILNDPSKGLSSSPHSVQHSVQFTNQKNADVLYVKYDIDNTTVNVDIAYKDVKSVYQGPKKGHIAIQYGLNDYDESKHYMSQHIEELKKLLGNFDTNFKEKLDELEDLRVSLKKKDSIEAVAKNVASLKKFNEVLLELSLEYKVPCTLAYDMPNDIDYLALYPSIAQAIQENSGIINVDTIFPKEKTFKVNTTRDTIKTIIEHMFPEEWKIKLSENYKKFIDDK